MKMRTVSPLECRDTSLAITFLLLLIWFFTGKIIFIYTAMVFLLVAMVFPKLMAPLAWAWLSFSHVLGLVMSKVILSIVYVLILLPVAVARKLMGKDSMTLNGWKAGQSSAFIERNHTYTNNDLNNMF